MVSFRRSIALILVVLLSITGFSQHQIRMGAIASSRRTTGGLVRNTNSVNVAAYAGVLQTTPDFGGVQNAYVLNLANRSRIQQTGTITAIGVYMGATRTNMTAFNFEVWRPNGTNFDRIATQNVFASITAGAGIKSITLSPSIAVQEGDLTGFFWTGSGVVPNFLTSLADQTTSSYYSLSVYAATTNYNWAGQTAAAGYIPIQCFMQAPHMVNIGDSYPSGYPTYYPPSDNTGYGNDYTFAYPYRIQVATSLVGENMAIEGDVSSYVEASFAADVVAKHPNIVVIHAGGNDVRGGRDGSGAIRTQTQTTTSFNNMMDAANTAGIKVFVLSIPPFNAATNTESADFDTRNTNLISACTTKGATFIDTRSTIGQFRTGGTAGNFWDIKTAYNSGDGVHLNATGYAALATYVSGIINAYLATL